MAFATGAELKAALRRADLQDDDTALTLALEGATGTIQVYTCQDIERVEDQEVILDPPIGRLLLLPQMPVSEVASVEVLVDGEWVALTEGEDYVVSLSRGFLQRLGASAGPSWTNADEWPSQVSPWGTGLGSIRVTYTHGYSEIPAAIKQVCLSLAARLFDNPTSLQQMTVAGFQAGYTPHDLTEGEKAILDRYKTGD